MRPPRTSRTIKALAAAVAAGSLLVAGAGCGAGSSAPKGGDRTVTIAQYQGIQSWLTQVAIAEGFFKSRGIDAKSVVVQSGPAAMAALASGAVDLVTADTPLTGPLMTQGKKLTILTGAHDTVFSLMGSSHAKFPNADKGFPAVMHDLKGKKVGVYALGSTAQYEVEALLAAAGMSKNDVQFQVTAGIQASLSALKAGQVDAAIISPPGQYLAEADGSTMLVDLRKPLVGATGDPAIARIAGTLDDFIWSTQKWANQDPELTDKVKAALVEAGTWIKDPANLDKLRTDVADFGLPPGDAAQQTEFLKGAVSVFDTDIDKTALEAWMDFVVSTGVMPDPIPIEEYLHN